MFFGATTFAGDTFAGGVMGYLASCQRFSQQSLKRAIAYGAVMATFAVEDFSVGRLSTVNKQDIKRRFKQFRQLSCF